MLKRFPAQASKTFIMTAGQLARDYAGAEFYVKHPA